MPLTITEIAQAARRPEVGANHVTVKDSGQTTTEADINNRVRTVLVREFDQVLVDVGGVVVDFLRLSGQEQPWTWSIEDDPRHHGPVNGTGDVLRAIQRAHDLAGTPSRDTTPRARRQDRVLDTVTGRNRT